MLKVLAEKGPASEEPVFGIGRDLPEGAAAACWAVALEAEVDAYVGRSILEDRGRSWCTGLVVRNAAPRTRTVKTVAGAIEVSRRREGSRRQAGRRGERRAPEVPQFDPAAVVAAQPAGLAVFPCSIARTLRDFRAGLSEFFGRSDRATGPVVRR